MPFNVSNILSRSAIAGNVFPGPLTKSYGSAVAAFNPLTDLPWDAVWQAGTNTFTTGTTPATDGQTVQNFGDALTGAKILTQATAGKRPNYRASVAKFNNKPAIQGNIANAASMKWSRGSNLSTYTVVVIGAHGVTLSSYSALVTDYSNSLFFPWVTNDTTVQEEFYTDATSYMRAVYNSNANLWHCVTKSGNTASRMGRNGFPMIGSMVTSTPLTGLSLFTYPTSEAFFSEGYVCFVGILPDAAASYAKWPQFLAWVETYYGIATTSRTMILCDSDSRSVGAGIPPDPGTPGNSRKAAAGYISDQFGLTWGMLLQGQLTMANTFAGSSAAGRTMATQITQASSYVTPAKTESIGAKYIVIVLDTVFNDLAGGDTPAQAYARLCTYIDDRHAEGWLVLTGTMAQGASISFNADRITTNALILANAGSGGGNGIADGVVDIANDADTSASNPFAFQNATTPWTPANFNADGIHWSVTGNSIIAGLVKTALAAAPFSVT